MYRFTHGQTLNRFLMKSKNFDQYCPLTFQNKVMEISTNIPHSDRKRNMSTHSKYVTTSRHRKHTAIYL
jgi:hypothetical protein